MFDLPIRPSFAQSLAVAAQKPSPSEAPSGGSDLIMGSKRCSTALSDIALIVRPLLATWRQLREQIAGHCQLSGPRALFPAPLGLSGAA